MQVDDIVVQAQYQWLACSSRRSLGCLFGPVARGSLNHYPYRAMCISLANGSFRSRSRRASCSCTLLYVRLWQLLQAKDEQPGGQYSLNTRLLQPGHLNHDRCPPFGQLVASREMPRHSYLASSDAVTTAHSSTKVRRNWPLCRPTGDDKSDVYVGYQIAVDQKKPWKRYGMDGGPQPRQPCQSHRCVE